MREPERDRGRLLDIIQAAEHILEGHYRHAARAGARLRDDSPRTAMEYRAHGCSPVKTAGGSYPGYGLIFA